MSNHRHRDELLGEWESFEGIAWGIVARALFIVCLRVYLGLKWARIWNVGSSVRNLAFRL